MLHSHNIRRTTQLAWAIFTILTTLILNSCATVDNRLPDPAKAATLAKKLQAVRAQEQKTFAAILAVSIGQTEVSKNATLNRVEKFTPSLLDPILSGATKSNGASVAVFHLCDRNTQPEVSVTIDPRPWLDRSIQMPVDNIHTGDVSKTQERLTTYIQKFAEVETALNDLERKQQENERAQKLRIADFKQRLAASLKIARSCQPQDLTASWSRTEIFLAQQQTLMPQGKKFSVLVTDKLGFYQIGKLNRDRDTTLILVSATKQNADKLSPNFHFQAPSPAFTKIERIMNYY